jgi:CDP-diacylglycerol--glycerol-3-phosphate 3-phosphatidyltransferase
LLAASLRRSCEDARGRPDLAREALAWGAAGGAIWAGAIALDARAAWGLAWWAVVVAMLWSHLGMVEGPDGARRDGLGPAMALTLSRAWLVPALPLVSAASWAFATLFAIGALADAADGPVARRRGEETRLGAHSDGAVDECLALSAAWTAAAAGWLPAWAAVLVSARCVVPPLMIALVYLGRAQAPPRACFVPGRLPGVAVALGLALTAVEPARPAALALVLAGTAGGALTAAASVPRVRRSLAAEA